MQCTALLHGLNEALCWSWQTVCHKYLSWQGSWQEKASVSVAALVTNARLLVLGRCWHKTYMVLSQKGWLLISRYRHGHWLAKGRLRPPKSMNSWRNSEFFGGQRRPFTQIYECLTFFSNKKRLRYSRICVLLDKPYFWYQFIYTIYRHKKNVFSIPTMAKTQSYVTLSPKYSEAS